MITTRTQRLRCECALEERRRCLHLCAQANSAFHPSEDGKDRPVLAGVRRGAFTSAGWQGKICVIPLWQVTPRSGEVLHIRYTRFTFTLTPGAFPELLSN